ncbi:hypothetical protein [Flaviaesturariibacter amylovorans]|uniref:hypothetical protein n=1 Tax=Flaviaesturariibacter amylovorans TaxID=1084520 RepID=UPI0031E71CD9
MPKHADPTFLYEVQVPVRGLAAERFVTAQGRLIDEATIELVNVPLPSERELSVWSEFVGLEPGGRPGDVLPLFEAGQQVTLQLEGEGSDVALVARGLSDQGWH